MTWSNNNHCWYNTNLATHNILNSNFILPQEPLVQNLWKYRAEDIFSAEWIDYCEYNKIYLKGDVMLFYKAPYFNSYRAHVDVNSKDPVIQHTTWALNWTINNHTSEMVWYDIPANTPSFTPSKDPIYLEWDSRLLTPIDRKQITDHIVLCRVDVPHDIRLGNEPRWCISARAWLGEGYDIMPEWSVVVERLNELKLIESRI